MPSFQGDLIKLGLFLFTGQAFYLNDFKRVFSQNAATFLTLQLQNQDKSVALLSCESNMMIMHLWNWNKESEMFEYGEHFTAFSLMNYNYTGRHYFCDITEISLLCFI